MGIDRAAIVWGRRLTEAQVRDFMDRHPHGAVWCLSCLGYPNIGEDDGAIIGLPMFEATSGDPTTELGPEAENLLQMTPGRAKKWWRVKAKELHTRFGDDIEKDGVQKAAEDLASMVIDGEEWWLYRVVEEE